MPNITINTDGSGPDDDVTPAEVESEGSGGQVVLRGIGIEKAYDAWNPFRADVDVLVGADLEIRTGEIVGIVGANGSGKSTLMRILVGALDADAGRVERTGRVGWCPQETLLYDRLTVEETFALFGAAYGLSTEAIANARDRLADRLDFEQFLDDQVRHLSGGNRQKVNLAVALLHDPDVLLLDEPYTGFDWETYLAFWELTEELTERGTAIAIISHFVSERDRFDRIYELRDGELFESDGDGDATDPEPDRAVGDQASESEDDPITDPTEVA